MLVCYFARPSRIEELRTNPGGHLLEGFAKTLFQDRYQWVVARKHIRAAEHFLHWMAHRKLSITSVEERCAQQFLNHLERCRCHGQHPPLKPHRKKYSIDLWLAYLRRAGVVTTPKPAEPAIGTPVLATERDHQSFCRGHPIRDARHGPETHGVFLSHPRVGCAVYVVVLPNRETPKLPTVSPLLPCALRPK